MSESLPRVGFIGLGNIGKPMAERLLAWEGGLTVFDIAPEPVADLVKGGAKAADSVGDLARECGVICVMVRDDEQVREVLASTLATASAGTVVVIHSTVAPETPGQLAELAEREGLLVVDAPVSGGSMGAAEGTLAIMVGGSRAAYDAAKAPLKLMGSKVIHAGEIGAGTQFKLARNLLHFVSFTAVSEAQRLAEAAGLDVKKLGEVVRHTDAITGGAGAIMLRETAAPIAADDFWFGVFEHVAALGEKDLTFAIALAEQLDVETPLAKLALQNLRPGLGLPAKEN